MLAENFPNLEQLYGQGALSGYLGGQQIDAARQSQNINQQTALQDMYWKDQTMPVDMDYKKALTFQTNQTGRGQEFKNDMNDRTKEEQYRAAITELSTKVSEDELKRAEAQIKALMIDPATREQGYSLHQHFSEVVAARQKAEDAKELERLRQRGAQDLVQKQSEAGKFSRGITKTLEDQINAAKSARERHQRLIDAATVARQAGNMDAAEAYLYRAEQIRPQAEAEIATPKPGGVAVDSVAPGLRTNPPPQIAPTGSNRVREVVRNAAGLPTKEQVESTKYPYEPDKYEYRFNAAGEVQRRPK
jgi:hypothetical protein